MKIVILTGAAFSGKDTLGHCLNRHLPDTVLTSFKMPLYRRMAEKYDISLSQTINICDAISKDKPSDLLGGLTPRSVLIDISENEFKQDDKLAVAKLVADDMRMIPWYEYQTFIFTGAGYDYEVEYIQQQFPEATMVTIEIVRDYHHYNDRGDLRNRLSNIQHTIVNDVDERHLPKKERGMPMFEKAVAILKNY